MKKLKLLLVMMIIFVSCDKIKSEEERISSDNNENIFYDISSEEKEIYFLKENEHISYEIVSGRGREEIELVINKVFEEQKQEIERYKINTFMGHVEQIENKIYFNKRNIYDESQGGNLFVFDGATGTLIDLGIEIVDSFRLSSDGNYLCYTIRTEVKYYEDYNMSLFIPGIEIKNFATGELYTYDFRDGFLKDLFGTSTSITYNNELHGFEFGFSMDAPNNIGQGYIDLSDMQYVQIVPMGDLP